MMRAATASHQLAVTVLIVVIAGWLVPAKKEPGEHVAE